MARTVKLKLAANDEQVEVELPEGYLTAVEHSAKLEVQQEKFETEIARRVSSASKNARTVALEDPEFRTAALKAWNVEPASKGGKAPDQAALDQMRKELADEIAKPLTDKLTAAETRSAKLVARALRGEILTAAQNAGMDPRLTKSVDGSEPAVVTMFGTKFGIDDESDGVFVRKGDRFALSTKEGQQYQDATEYFDGLRNNKDYTDLFVDERQRGAAVKDGKSGAVTKPGQIAKGDMVAFGNNLEAIAKGTIVVEP